ncbi:MAG TPA: TraR/DksA C4-type zinc finger protein [Gemmatimonadaceae bacterium]|nr:TraR/DksA C4-type zinc finger protein [Gemmatimonadaceae bacterium]
MSTARKLTRAQLRELERDLRGERARLERTMMSAITAGASTLVDDGSPALAESEFGLALETRTRARHEALLDALRRLEAGTYGICVGCRNPIPYGRLLAMPETARCVACAARA